LSVEFLPVDGGGSLVVYRDSSWQRKAEVYHQTLGRDLVTLLNSINHVVNLIRQMRATMTDQQQDEILAIASRNGAYMKLELIFLRDQIRYENLAGSLRITEVTLSDIIRLDLEPLQQAYDVTHIQIDTDRDPPRVRCDRGRLGFVLLALFIHVINLQDGQQHITFSVEDQHLMIDCAISHHSDPFYCRDLAHRDLCQRLLEQQSGTFEFTVSSDTTQHCVISLPIASEPATP
jgi:light-regulated signal transduction histidine kinase (bacteriophytochrome)